MVGCGKSVVRTAPVGDEINESVTDMWAAEVAASAKSGDWLLTRSYSFVGDVIAFGSFRAEISHSSIYDAGRNTVIEAVGGGVREVALRDLLARNRVVVVIRPDGFTDAQRRYGLERARSRLGAKYDFGGLVGAQADDRFYCSELATWSLDLKPNAPVITPSSLVEFGTAQYISGNRDDPQVVDAARVRAKMRKSTPTKSTTPAEPK